jgi:RHS repeat-associated protein
MNTKIFSGAFLSLAILSAIYSPDSTGQAMDFTPESKVNVLDEVGVDLLQARPIKSYGNLSLGDPANPAVDFTMFSTSLNVSGRTPLFASYDFNCTTYGGVPGCIYSRYQWNINGQTEFFSWPPYPPNSPGTQGITQQGSQFSGSTLYRREDGSVWVFDSSAPGRVTSATYPDGTTLTFNYGTASAGGATWSPLRSVVSSRGYMVHLEGLSQYQGATPTKVTLINLNVDYCAPTAATCTGLTRAWPSVTYGISTVGSVTTLTATDHLGRVASRVGTVSPSVIEGDWNKWTTTYRYTSPGGIWFEYQNEVKASRLPSGISGRPCTASALLSWLKNAEAQWNYSSDAERRCFDVVRTTFTSTAPDGGTRRATPEGVFDELNRRVQFSTYGFQDFYGYSEHGISSKVLPEGNRLDYLRDARNNHRETVVTSKSGTSTISTSASYPATCSLTTYKTCNKADYTIDANGKRTDYTYHAHGGIDTMTMPPDELGVRPKIRHYYIQQSARFKVSASGYTYGSPIWVLTDKKICKTGVSCGGTTEEVVTTYAYNDNLLRTSETVKDGTGAVLSQTVTGYDEFGNVTSIDGSQTGAADTWHYFFDAARRNVGEIGPDPDGSGPLLRPARRSVYDADDHVTRVDIGTATAATLVALDAMIVTNYTASTFDALGRLTKEVSVGGGVTHNVMQYSYDLRSRVKCTAVRMNPATYASLPASACDLTLVGPYGPDRIVRNYYDAAGQLVQIVHGEGTPDRRAYATRTYTANGNIADSIDANGNRTRQTYDDFDRRLDLFYPSTTRPAYDSSSVSQALATAGSHNPNDFERLQHDNNGNVISWRRRDNSTIGYQIDSLNRVVLKDLPGSARDIYIRYDLTSNALHKRFDSHTGEGVSYVFDALGRVSSTTDMNGRTVAYGYSAASVRNRLTFPGGDYVGSTIDPLNRLTNLGWNSNSGLVGRIYDPQGNLVTVTKGAGATSYTYDAIGNLASVNNDLAGTDNDVRWGFPTYNAAMQIQVRESSSTRFDFKPSASLPGQTHDGLNRISSIVALPGGYDARQNLATDGTRSFTFDAEDRLLTATGGGASVTLTYDPEGRVARYSANSVETRFLYDGESLIAEYDSSGNLLRRYVHGPGADQPLVLLEGSGSGDVRYFYANRQGSIVATATSGGSLLGLYKYGPYGEPRDSNDAESWSGPRFRYTGQLAVPEAKLCHFKTRAYDPALGRFLQTDPIGSADDLNLYAYVGGDPMNAVDPTGTQMVTPILTPPPTTILVRPQLAPLSAGPRLSPIAQGVRTAIRNGARISAETVRGAHGTKVPRWRPTETGQQYLQRLQKLGKEFTNKLQPGRGDNEVPIGPVRYVERLDFMNKFGDFVDHFYGVVAELLPKGTVEIVTVDEDGNEIPPGQEGSEAPDDQPEEEPLPEYDCNWDDPDSCIA